MIESLLYGYLSTAAAVIALVSTRIYPLHLPQDVTYPAISYQVISRTGLYDNPRVTTQRFVQYRIQVDIFAATYASAKAIQAVVVPALYQFKSSVNAAIVSTHVDSIEDAHDIEDGAYRVSIDCLVVHNE